MIDLDTYIKFILDDYPYPRFRYGRIVDRTSERYGISIFDPYQVKEVWFAWIFLNNIKHIYENREEMLVEFIMGL